MNARGDPFQTLKRRIYLFVLPVISLTVILTFLMGRTQQYYSSFDIVVLPVLAVLLLFFTALVYAQRPALAVVEQALYIAIAMVFLAKFAHSIAVVYTAPGSQSELTQTYVWAPIIYVLAFLIFEPRGALLRSLGIYAFTLAIGLTSLLTREAGSPGPEDRIFEFYLSSGIIVLLLATFANLRQRVAQLQASLTQMHQLAHQDVLTGVPNRRQLETDLELEFSKAERYGQPLSLIMLDLDHFKRINDEHGHDAGDATLKAAAHLLKNFLRDSDSFGRWGGEEFLIVTPQTDLQASLQLAERLRLFIAGHAFGVGPLTASFGVASLQEDDAPAALVKRADEALYLAKNFGRNRVEALTRELAQFVKPPELYCPFTLHEATGAETLNRATLEWLQGFGLATREKVYRWVTAVSPGWLAAYVHRRASLEARQLISDWYMWMFLHDDRCDESDVGKSPTRLTALNARLLEILRGAALTPQDEPLAAVLANLHERLRAVADEPWLARLSLRVEDYFAATVWEAGNRAQHITPSLSTYLLKRLLTSGTAIDSVFMELADGVTLPLEVWEHPRVRYLTLVADNAVCWANDIFSLNKEVQKSDVHNLVLALQQTYKLSLLEAVRRAGEMHDAEVRNFVENEPRLPSFGPERDAQLATYLDILRARMAGNIVWSRAARRYQSTAPARLRVPG